MVDRAINPESSPDNVVLYASDLDKFLYCERSWWYAMQGEASSRTAELEQGTQQHEALAGNVRDADRAAAFAKMLIWISLGLFGAVLAARLLLGG